MSTRSAVIALMICIAVGIVGALGVIMWYDPANVLTRANLRLDSETWQRLIGWSLSIAVAILVLSASLGVSARLLARGVNAFATGIHLIYPDRRGLLPAVAGMRIITTDHLDQRANVELARNSGTQRALGSPKATAPVEDAPLLPEPVAALPTRIDVFDAPLPDVPSLMLGMGEHGPITLELADAGHVLIGGSPRNGKTTLLGAILIGLARLDPSGALAQVALADLKRVDFALLPQDLRLLWQAPAYDEAQALELLTDLDSEMQRRLSAFGAARVKKLEQWNTQQPRLPYLVCIIDEIAELTTHGDRDIRERATALIEHVGKLGGAAESAASISSAGPTLTR